MRHKGTDKNETRQKMLDAASCSFRKFGYAGVGVDALSKAAGVTSGAFYAHFGSKDGAFNASLSTGLDEVIVGITHLQNTHGTAWVKAFADYYLGKQHQQDLGTGCAMATLTAEVVRFGPEVRGIFEEKMTLIAGLVASGLAGGSEDDRSARAWAMLSVLIGGLNVVRAVKSPNIIEEISAAIKAAAIKAAGRARATSK